MLGKLASAGLTALLVGALTTTGASARTLATYDYNATGIETSVPTGNTSPFSGAAIGPSGLALWSASVPHDQLSACSPTGITTGGAFTLNGTRGVRLAGSFTGGSVTPPANFCQGGSAPCANESFAVDGHLTLNGGAFTGEFVGTLTHFSRMFGGTCVTFFATISGHLSVNPSGSGGGF